MVLRWKTELTLRASHVSPISVTNAFSSALRGKGNVIPAAAQNEFASAHVPIDLNYTDNEIDGDVEMMI